MRLFKITSFLFFVCTGLLASTNYFEEGLALFQKKEFSKAKFKFEQDIVFNPKNAKSYLYLSKIFKAQEKKEQNDVLFYQRVI